MCNLHMIKRNGTVGVLTVESLKVRSISGGRKTELPTTLELRGDRVIGNNSIIAREDGSFFDFNGSVNYRDHKTLIRAHPELAVKGGSYSPPKESSSPTHNSREVTQKALRMKARFNQKTLDAYLTLYDMNRIISNIGFTYDGELAVFMWKTTASGALSGAHYSICQYRGDERAKWMSLKGSDAKTIESIVTDDSPVYVTFGMGDFLILKSTGLNYMCFAGDGAAKNSPYVGYMKSKVGNRSIRLIADNDYSGRKTVKYLRSYGFDVEMFDWGRLGDLVKLKMDLRDLAGIIKSGGGNLDDLTELLTTGEMYVY